VSRPRFVDDSSQRSSTKMNAAGGERIWSRAPDSLRKFAKPDNSRESS